jgi:hypothetical protein
LTSSRRRDDDWNAWHIWKEQKHVQGFDEEAEGKRALGRHGIRWECNKERGWEYLGLDSCGSGYGQVELLTNTIMLSSVT